MAGNSSVTGDQTITNTDNLSFDGTSRGGAMSLDGQLWIGATLSNRSNNGGHVRLGFLTSTGGTLTISNLPGAINIEVAGGGAAVEHLTGSTGGQLNPTANNFNLLGATAAAGTTPVTIAGAGSTLTTTIQISQALAAADATKIGLANFDSSSFTVAATGFVTLLTTGVLKTLTGNSGGAISPTANNINTLGTGSITIAGAGSTLTTQLTGLTNHAIQIGAGTATLTQLSATATTGQVLQNNASADPSWSTATYPSTTTVSQILYSSSTNVVAGLATANQGVLTTGATGIPVITALATNGQLIIGSTAGVPAAATLSAGTGIAITNGSNSISIANVQGGFAWSDTSGTVTAVAQNGYFITTTCTSTLPASPSEGDTVKYIVDTTNLLTITGNTGQKIRIGTQLSAAAGTAVNTQRGDAITLVYRTSGTTWFADGNPVGGWNVT